jgi:2-dehydropantoate 2-reductase
MFDRRIKAPKTCSPATGRLYWQLLKMLFPEKVMRIAIVGAGALGGYYGAMLARRGYDVHFLFHSDYEAVKRQGLTVHSINGDFHLDRVNGYADSRQIGAVDLVFVGLKTTRNDLYHELLTPLVGLATVVLTAQNGLGNEERLAELFGPGRVAGGLAFLCSQHAGPGVIRHLDYGYMRVGNFQRPPDRTLNEFAEMMNLSGVQCAVVEDLALARWKKLIWNVPFNGLSALLDRTVDKIMADEPVRQRAWRLMKEVQAAADAFGLIIGDDFLEKMMADTLKMHPYATSMQLDRQNRRPMEIESILGEPLRRGRNRRVPMPETESLYQGLLDLDRAHLSTGSNNKIK